MTEHQRINEHVNLLEDELEEMGYARSASEWISEKMEDSQEALMQLEKLLTSLERELAQHWHREGKELIPFLKECGQDKFVSTLLNEHRLMGGRLRKFRKQAGELAREEISDEELAAKIKNIKDALKETLAMLEEHAAREEQMLFWIGHGV